MSAAARFLVGGVPIRPSTDSRFERPQTTRTNERIRVPFVRLIGADGAQLGVVPTREALNMARDQGLDLVEVQANANPPVCKVTDYGKMQYEKGKATKQTTQPRLKEVKAHPNTGAHDLEVLIERARGFLVEGHRTKLTVQFRGREMAHQELGYGVIQKFTTALADVSTPEGLPKMEGRFYSVIVVPTKK
jgi:translation initiation factor IF-3